MVADRRVCVGVITGAHGVRGLVRVKSFTAEPDDLVAYGPLTDADGHRRFELEITGRARGLLLARVAGVEDRDTAEALRGTELYVERAAFPPTEEDEFYHADLIGLRVELADGTVYGTVKALHNFGAGDMIEVAVNGGSDVILPFSRAVVPVVDLDAGRVVIAPPGVVEARPGAAGDTSEEGGKRR